MRKNNFKGGRSLYNQALVIIEEDKEDFNKAFLFKHMGELEMYCENNIYARECFQLAIRLSEQIGDDLSKTNTLLNLVDLEITEKNTEIARETLKKVRILYKTIGVKQGEYNTLLYTAKLILRLEQSPQEALNHLLKAEAGFEAIGGREGVAEVGFYRAESYHQLQQPEKALEHYQDASLLAEKLNIAPLNKLAKETAAIIGIAESI